MGALAAAFRSRCSSICFRGPEILRHISPRERHEGTPEYSNSITDFYRCRYNYAEQSGHLLKDTPLSEPVVSMECDLQRLGAVLAMDDCVLLDTLSSSSKITITELKCLLGSRGIKCNQRSMRTKGHYAALVLVDLREAFSAAVSARGDMDIAWFRETYEKVFDVLWALKPSKKSMPGYWSDRRRNEKEAALNERKDDERQIIESWPQPISEDVLLACSKDYYNATKWEYPEMCAACARSIHGAVITKVHTTAVANPKLPVVDFTPLTMLDPRIIERSGDSFRFPEDASLDGRMLDRAAVCHVDGGGSIVNLCADCLSSLKAGSVPKFSLRNDLYRGELPAEFKDITWMEERVCAIYCTTSQVTRLFHRSSGASDGEPFVMHGNSCAYELNSISTATVLPRTPTDVNGFLAVVFVGPGPVKPAHLRQHFRVRKDVIMRFLRYLKANNDLYANIEISDDNAQLYSEDDLPPGLLDRVVHDPHSDPSELFHEESAGFDEHPGDAFVETARASGNGDTELLLEKMGVADPEGNRIPGRTYVASALLNLVNANDAESDRRENTSKCTVNSSGQPTLFIAHGSAPINEYRNPTLFPGLFPTLYPLGCGGFESRRRSPALSFQVQANYYMDLADRSFRYHQFFIFVALNIMQRRAAHLQTYFTVRRSNFEDVARELADITPEDIRSVALLIEKGQAVPSLTDDQKKVIRLLEKVKAVSARVPGSQASKIHARNVAYAFEGFFGIPELYFTMNPDALHSPIFQVMFGDKAVDLSSRFPQMPAKDVRARRLAQDPVAAADFFAWSMRMFFQHLCGWDFDTGRSSSRGGIMGRLRAFLWTTETTDRGRLHGHSLGWLVGGLNPRRLHEKLQNSSEFQARFFGFFEQLIQHHLPDVEYELPKQLEPEIQRPPEPGCPDWSELRLQEAKFCGERFQRHSCKPVCHKYNHQDSCRFLFPHEVIEASYYDESTHSIYLKCRDPTVNYCNWYILVLCRHNHDLKFIHSGKGAKAAIFYITDYITKGDLRTHEMLTLLSRAVARIPDSQSLAAKDKAKQMLHKCVSQFQREQQIPAQLAARYIRGMGDITTSHDTVPMLSSVLMAKVRRWASDRSNVSRSVGCDNANGHSTVASDEQQDEDAEPEPVKISVSDDGALNGVNQVDDYWYRSHDLASMCFYDFVRYVKKYPKNDRCPNGGAQRSGKRVRYALRDPHPQADTHELAKYSDLDEMTLGREVVPRIIGCATPRVDSDSYHLFVVAHFVPIATWSEPFDLSRIEDVFDGHVFSPLQMSIMENWEAMRECEDERDAERLKRRSAFAKESKVLNAMYDVGNGGDEGIVADITAQLASLSTQSISTGDREASKVVQTLTEAGFFDAAQVPLGTEAPAFKIPTIDKKLLKKWDADRAVQERRVREIRETCVNPLTSFGTGVADTQIGFDVGDIPDVYEGGFEAVVPETMVVLPVQGPVETEESLMNRVVEKFGLNEMQSMAFRIVSRRFFVMHAGNTSNQIEGDPSATGLNSLRMFLTGPGGTGKTHIVKALADVMASYNCGHRIRYVAPTGSAAALIDGTTIHDGFNITVEKGLRSGGADSATQDWTMVIGVKQKQKLRDEWEHVWFVLMDEASMISEQLLARCDHALKYAKESLEWFGGVNVILAGDLYQYAPVHGSPLYAPITNSTQQSNGELMRRLGRMAYKTFDTVVELTEQKRMEEDEEYANAVMRLRIRDCSEADVELFNSRVIRSAMRPDGIDLRDTVTSDIVTIVATNSVREAINARTALANTEGKDAPDLVVCAAEDFEGKTVVSNPEVRDRLLRMRLNGTGVERSLPGVVPLYEGMPVILRNKNISTLLKITNGGQGFVRKIETRTDSHGKSVSDYVLVEFPASPIELPGLPRGWIAIQPSRWSFTVGQPIFQGATKVSRSQLPLQPAFAVTGHSAQGKTLPKVMMDLQQGGFHAYVGASRPRSRHGLFLLNPVTLDDLRVHLPADLIREDVRLKALAHNTAIRHGFASGPEVPVPDPEDEDDLLFSRRVPNIQLKVKSAQKRARESNVEKAMGDSETVCGSTSAKRRKLNAAPLYEAELAGHKCEPQGRAGTALQSIGSSCGPRNVQAHLAPFTGSTWDAENYSCAYDSFFMAFSSLLFSPNAYTFRSSFRNAGPFSFVVEEVCSELTSPGGPRKSSSEVNRLRDRLRDYLFMAKPDVFPRYGPQLASIEYMTDMLQWERGSIRTRSSFECVECSDTREVESTASGYMNDVLWNVASAQYGYTSSATSASISTWVPLLFGTMITDPIPQDQSAHTHQWRPRESPAFLDNPPPWLRFDYDAQFSAVVPLSTRNLAISVVGQARPAQYSIRCIVYLGHAHYAARVFMPDGTVWIYDGMVAAGEPQFEFKLLPSMPFPANHFRHLSNRPSVWFLYGIDAE